MERWNSVASDTTCVVGDGISDDNGAVLDVVIPNETYRFHAVNAVSFKVNHRFTSGVLASRNHCLSRTMFLRNIGGNFRLVVDLVPSSAVVVWVYSWTRSSSTWIFIRS
jgi:hypothetical protein